MTTEVLFVWWGAEGRRKGIIIHPPTPNSPSHRHHGLSLTVRTQDYSGSMAQRKSLGIGSSQAPGIDNCISVLSLPRSPLSVLILFTGAISIFFLQSLAEDLSISLPFHITSLVFITSSFPLLFGFFFICFHTDLYHSYVFLLTLGFVVFFSSLRYKCRLVG